MSEVKVYRRRGHLTGYVMKKQAEQDIWMPETPKKQCTSKPQEKVYVKRKRSIRNSNSGIKAFSVTNAEFDPCVALLGVEEAVKEGSPSTTGERSVIVDPFSAKIGEEKELSDQGKGTCLESVGLIDLNKSVWCDNEDAGFAEMESESEVVDLSSENQDALPPFDLQKERKNYGRPNQQQNRKSKNAVRLSKKGGLKLKKKKHRPKVVVDRGQEKNGRARRKLTLKTPKKAKENSSQRRKYVRKMKEKRLSLEVPATACVNSVLVQMAEVEQGETVKLQLVEAEQGEFVELQPDEIEQVDAMIVSLRKIGKLAVRKTRGKRKRRTYFGLPIPKSWPAVCSRRRSRRICALKYASKRLQLLDIDLNQTQNCIQGQSLIAELPVAEENSVSSSAFHDYESSLVPIPVHSVEQSIPYSEFHNHEDSLISVVPVQSVEQSILNLDFHCYENPLGLVPAYSEDQSIPSLDFHNHENSLISVPVNSVEQYTFHSDFHNYGCSPISVPALPEHYEWPRCYGYPASLCVPAPLWVPSMPLYLETVHSSTFAAAGQQDLTVTGNLDFWAGDYELIPHQGGNFPAFSLEIGIKRSQIEFITKKLQAFHVSDVVVEWVKRNEKAQGKRKIDSLSYQEQTPKGQLVPYRKELGEVVPFIPIKKKFSPKVDLDPETLRVWNKLMNISDGKPDLDKENEKWWEGQRGTMRIKIDCFISRMHLIQGDRQFREWKGSVIDSVVGVFLTQNVCDFLSSSAYMQLTAKFGCPTHHSETYDRDMKLLCSQESVASNSENCQYFVSEPEPEPERRNLINTRDAFVNMVEESSSLHIEDITSSPCFQDEVTLVSQVTSNHEPEVMQQYDTAIISKKRKLLHTQEQDSCGVEFRGEKASTSGVKNKNVKEKVDWDELRKTYSTGEPRSSNRMDSVDWEAVRCADPAVIAETIKDRGQHTIIAGRIKDFLNGLVEQHGSLDLEWLRNVPPEKAKDYLLDVPGLGLKSVECIRLLSLQNVAFPVDTNVGRIAVRLGWVPLQTLPEELQIHLLEQYPLMDSIQKYLWPRLCTLDQQTLYELHYQLITFGKVFCTKRNPNCNACPMRGDCRHFASAYASARLALPAPPEKRIVTSEGPQVHSHPGPVPQFQHESRNSEPIIEEPVIELPDIEDMPSPKFEVQEVEPEYDSDGIPIIKLNVEKFRTNLLNFIKESKIELPDGIRSTALVSLDPVAASIPAPKLKYVSRLRSEHLVYELPKIHHLLNGFEELDPDDRYNYHLAIWSSGETPNSLVPPQSKCNSEGSELCYDQECYSCNNIREQNSNIVRGTILIPCRTAMRGFFPLNGTYFQHNEVFADHQTSHHPIDVPRDLIYNLRTRTAFFGTSTSAITKGLTTREIQECFWNGIVCFRGFDRSNGAPRPLAKRLHCPLSKMRKSKGGTEQINK